MPAVLIQLSRRQERQTFVDRAIAPLPVIFLSERQDKRPPLIDYKSQQEPKLY